jgi:hypothetical protein
MIPFDAVFPDVARQEMRVMTILEDGQVPADDYMFREFYCVEKGCDCRRVILNIIAARTRKEMATINHALDPKALHYEAGRETVLEPFGQQTKHSAALLELCKTVVLQPEYSSRLKRHYRMIKEAVEAPAHPAQEVIARAADPQASHRRSVRNDSTKPAQGGGRKIGRNDPCLCGSGKKYKKCCISKVTEPEANTESPRRRVPEWEVEVVLPPPKAPRRGSIELHPDVPRDLRRRLEQARLETLVLLRSMDRARVCAAPSDFSPELRALMELDADCAEALWGLDQPMGAFSVRLMLRDTLASLDRLPFARGAALAALKDEDLRSVEAVKDFVVDTLGLEECYSQVKGRDPDAG